MKSDIDPEPNLNVANDPKGAVDATFHPGVAVPATPPVTSYLRLMQHLGQPGILLQSFLEGFRNCNWSLLSSRG